MAHIAAHLSFPVPPSQLLRRLCLCLTLLRVLRHAPKCVCMLKIPYQSVVKERASQPVLRKHENTAHRNRKKLSGAVLWLLAFPRKASRISLCWDKKVIKSIQIKSNHGNPSIHPYRIKNQVNQSIHPSIYLDIYLDTCLPLHLSIYPSFCLSIYLCS